MGYAPGAARRADCDAWRAVLQDCACVNRLRNTHDFSGGSQNAGTGCGPDGSSGQVGRGAPGHQRCRAGRLPCSISAISKVPARRSGKTSPLVGTWAENSNFGQGCIHIAEQTPGEFIGWSDDIQLPGTVRSCIDNVSKPVSVFQRFGERLKARLEKDCTVSFEFHAFNDMCCSHTFVGKLAEGGDLIHGTWPSGANQFPHDATWKKMTGDSCVASDSEQTQPNPRPAQRAGHYIKTTQQ